MRIPFRYKIILALALIHLTLVACGMAYVNFSDLPLLQLSRTGMAVGDALDFYGEATGSGDAYGFFSPGIEGQMTVWFELEDQDGHHTRAFLPSDSNREARLRVGDIVDQFSEPHKDPTAFQRAMTASFAAKIAQLHPEARKISVHIDQMTSVSMDEFKKGKRLTWKPLYQADYLPPRAP